MGCGDALRPVVKSPRGSHGFLTATLYTRKTGLREMDAAKWRCVIERKSFSMVDAAGIMLGRSNERLAPGK